MGGALGILGYGSIREPPTAVAVGLLQARLLDLKLKARAFWAKVIRASTLYPTNWEERV